MTSPTHPRASGPALIERLEAASYPSRELDADVYEALGYMVKRAPQYRRQIAWQYRKDGTRWESMRRLTASLDDALSMVPNGWAWTAHSTGTVTLAKGLARRPIVNGFSTATPALGACAAVLKARAARGGAGDE